MTVVAMFAKGDNVKVTSTGKVGTINQVLHGAQSVGYRVTVDGRTITYQEKYLAPHKDEELEILDGLAMQDFGGAEQFHLFQTWFRLKRPMEGNFYSYLASRTTFNPYQFKPLSKFIAPGSEERLFIADEVGVGKTIETGIILTELLARGRIDRKNPILIVCPNILGPKWKKEMQKRFNLPFHLHDGKSLENALLGAVNGVFPDGATWAIVGLQLLRNKKYLDLLEKISAARQTPPWSMVIIDEAHHMRNSVADSNSVGKTLSNLTEMMLMLSATPLNLKDEDLFQQMHILNPAMFPDLPTFHALLSPVKSINRCRRLLMENDTTVYREVLNELTELKSGPLGHAISTYPGVQDLDSALQAGKRLSTAELAEYERMLLSLSPLNHSFTRTLKREAMSHRVTRETIKVPVQLNADEMQFHEDVVKVVQETYLAGGGDPTALGFITNMPRRMVSSCIPAMKEYLDWCLRSNKMLKETQAEVDDDSELDSTDLSPELRGVYRDLRDQAAQLGEIDSKYTQFSRVIQQLLQNLENPQVVVFSFFVRTLKYLKVRLEAEGYRVGIITGEMPLQSDGKQFGRYDVIDAFENKEFDILLSSEVGGEGLDFQFCQAMVNYDLPYNPMRIEQRIGRIDRFGQQAEKVIIVSMYIEGTVDERIYDTLYDRIRLVEDSIGIMEPILGSALADLQREMISGHLTAEQLEVRTKEIELAVEQSKIEYERFETNRKELMGDDHFSSLFHDMEKGNKFVGPSDAAKLTSIYLSTLGAGCNYREVDQHRAVITLSKDMIERLESFTRRPGSEGSLEEVGQLLKGKSATKVIFNGSTADQFKDHIFLPPFGFWIRFVLSELESRGTMSKVFALSSCESEAEGILAGRYLVPFFEVKTEGFRVELDLAAVPIRMTDSQVVACDYRKLSRSLGTNIRTNGLVPDLADEDSNQMIDLARESLESSMEDRMIRLRQENEYRVEARIGSLERGSAIRVERWRKREEAHVNQVGQQAKVYSPEFIRMMDAQIANDKARTKDKIEKLKNQKELSLAVSLMGVVVLDVVTAETEGAVE